MTSDSLYFSRRYEIENVFDTNHCKPKKDQSGEHLLCLREESFFTMTFILIWSVGVRKARVCFGPTVFFGKGFPPAH